MTADVTGAYLNAPDRVKGESVHSVWAQIWSQNVSRMAIITKALYGLQMSDFAF